MKVREPCLLPSRKLVVTSVFTSIYSVSNGFRGRNHETTLYKNYMPFRVLSKTRAPPASHRLNQISSNARDVQKNYLIIYNRLCNICSHFHFGSDGVGVPNFELPFSVNFCPHDTFNRKKR
jgi:hypothetical protein